MFPIIMVGGLLLGLKDRLLGSIEESESYPVYRDNYDADLADLSGDHLYYLCRCGATKVPAELINDPRTVKPCLRCRTIPYLPQYSWTDRVMPDEHVKVSMHTYDLTTDSWDTNTLHLEPNNPHDMILFGQAIEQAFNRGVWNGVSFENGGKLKLITDWWRMFGYDRFDAEKLATKGNLPTE